MLIKRGKSWTYNFRWTIKNQDGTNESFRIRQSAKTHKRKDAEDAENEHRRALRLGEIHPLDPWPKPEAAASAAPLFRNFSKEFLAQIKAHKKESTHTFYDTCLNRILTFASIADATLDKITSETVSRYIRYRTEIAKNSLTTVNCDVRTLRAVLNLAEEWGRIDKAPTLHENGDAKGRDRVLGFEEEQLYLAKASQNLRDAAILAVDTGMRPNSELFPLRWTDVNLTASTECPQGVVHVRAGKTDNAPRAIPLTPRASGVLRARKKAAEDTKDTSVYVFPSSSASGHLVSVQHPHRRAIEDAGLKSFEFYTLRHTFGTRCAMAGMDKFSLARLMGHSSPSVAEKYYIHVTTPHVAAGAAKFTEYLEKGIAEGLKTAFPNATEAVQ